MNVALAMTHHDPEGRMYDQILRNLPTLTGIFSGFSIRTTHNSHPASLKAWVDAGAQIDQETPADALNGPLHGKARRAVIALALRLDVPYVMYSDCDRLLHWVEFHRAELIQVIEALPAHDLTILGRTPRAFESHPRIQRDTESIINHVFATVSGQCFDVTAAARGLSRRAAEAILAGCPDDNISVDGSWPLFIQQTGGFSVGYRETDGLEFETADRFSDEVAKAGGLTQWIAQLDADPRQWAQRLDLARIEVEGMQPYAPRLA